MYELNFVDYLDHSMSYCALPISLSGINCTTKCQITIAHWAAEVNPFGSWSASTF